MLELFIIQKLITLKMLIYKKLSFLIKSQINNFLLGMNTKIYLILYNSLKNNLIFYMSIVGKKIMFFKFKKF